ncbi:MAG: DNA polymerase III subunit beta [bacterium]
MNLIINQKEFYNGIQIVQRAVSSKSTLPILKGIYMEAHKDKGIKLIGNNLEMGIEYWVNADIIEEGSIVLPATELSNIIRELPSSEISFNVNLEHYQVNIECLNSKFTLKGFQADEFPQLPEVENAFRVNLPSDYFSQMIEEVRFATSTDQTQPALTGGLLVFTKDSINLVSTNTYRLSYSSMKNNMEIDENINIILPGSTLQELSNLIDNDGDINLSLNNSYIRFSFNEIIFISRLIEGQFPNYMQVVPADYKSRVKVDRRELLDAVKRASLIARLDTNIISIKIEQDKMFIFSNSTEYGKAQEIIEVELEGPEQNIDIDASYLIDVLKVLKEEVIVMEMISPLNALTIKKENNTNFIYLIMPIRPGA